MDDWMSQHPPLNAVLTKAELADFLRCAERQIDRLDLPVVYLGERTPRYIVWRVVEELERRETL